MADRGVPIISRRVGLAVLYCALCMWVGGAFIAASLPRPAVAVDTEAQQFILMDAGTGMVLAEKNSDEPMYPASMSKIMTLYVAYEHLADGRLSMDGHLCSEQKSVANEGSRMFVEVNSKVTVGELLRGIAVQSGNDASIVIAEGLAGSEAAFADLMNETAPNSASTTVTSSTPPAGPIPTTSPRLATWPSCHGASLWTSLSTTRCLPRRATPTTASSRATATRCSTALTEQMASRRATHRPRDTASQHRRNAGSSAWCWS